MSNTMTIPFLVLENPVLPLQLVQYLDPIDPEVYIGVILNISKSYLHLHC